MPAILINGGPLSGRRVEVNGAVVIGREGADLNIEDRQLSRRHAIFRPVDGAIEIEDLGSLNGTYVNGARIAGPTRIQPRDVVSIGVTVLEVLEPDVAEAPLPPAADSPGAAPAAPPPSPPPEPQEAAPAAAARAAEPEPASPIAQQRTVISRRPVAPEPAAGEAAAPAAATAVSAPPQAHEPTAEPRRLGRRNLEWLAAACAFPFAVFTLVGVVLPTSKTPRPDSESQDYVEFFTSQHHRIQLAFGFITVAVLFFWPYLGLLWRTLRNAEGEPAWLSATVFGAGISMASISVAENAFWGAAAYSGSHLDPDLARIFFHLGSIYFMSWLPLTAFLIGSAVLIFTTGVFPRWLGWGAAVAAPLVLVSGYPGGPIVLQLLAHLGLVWWVLFTLITGSIMMKRARGAGGAAPPPPLRG